MADLVVGFNIDGFPSMGAWTTYALGSENADLPAFVTVLDPPNQQRTYRDGRLIEAWYASAETRIGYPDPPAGSLAADRAGSAAGDSA